MWQYFEMRVTTFVAQIIGFADNNNNLDLLLDDATPAWKCRMWLRMLDNPQVTQLGAGEDMEPANSEDLEILVKTYGAHGSAMTGCLPFSWVIKRAIDSFPLASVKWRGGFMHLHISYVVTHSRCQFCFLFFISLFILERNNLAHGQFSLSSSHIICRTFSCNNSCIFGVRTLAVFHNVISSQKF